MRRWHDVDEEEVIDRLTVICEKPINLIEYKESWVR